MFKKLLIANRGEIACRILRTAQRMGMRCVAVYSDADANAKHVRLADEAVRIGPAPAQQSYLVIEEILAAAHRTGAQAVHPGYGFLSENPVFAQACLDAGLVFVGPPPEAIRAMGSKAAAKAQMAAAGVPLTAGYHGPQQDSQFLQAQADRIGYPILIKASAGGGGKGMRRVDHAADFADALAACQRESQSAFGDSQVLLEQFVVSARHIEIQVFADQHGNHVHLFERDCSVQRRHQKVLEEAPAPGLGETRRAAMGAAAVQAAKAVGYVGAGTVEFLVGPDERFYFMEMNTRLQVEHPVTEMITGVDLVEWQLRIAAGECLPLRQEGLAIRGHSIEARLYAEDPARDFMPASGRLQHFNLPTPSESVRIESGYEGGDEVSVFYDPMMAKLVVWGSDRDQAIARMQRALAQTEIIGVANNVAFLARLIGTASFTEAKLDTELIAREAPNLWPPASAIDHEVWYLAAFAQLLLERGPAAAMADAAQNSSRADSPWDIHDSWRLNGTHERRLRFRLGTTEQVLICQVDGDVGGNLDGDADGNVCGYQIAFAEAPEITRRTLRGRLASDGQMQILIDQANEPQRAVKARVRTHGDDRTVFAAGGQWRLTLINPLQWSAPRPEADASLLAPMPGKVVAVLVALDTPIEAGSPLMVLEAMKMEHTLHAPCAGVVRAFHYEAGDPVAEGAVLLQFEATSDLGTGSGL